MLNIVFNFFSNYLIEFMSVLLVVGLAFRWASYRSSIREDVYFSTFTSEVEKILASHKDEENQIKDVDAYLGHVLDDVADKLPTRTVRLKKSSGSKKRSTLGAKEVVSLRDYVSGEKSLFHSIKAESGSFKSKFPPSYSELTERILEKDDNWNKLMGIFPIAPISRLNDVLPGLFVVFGIFGTFIGISMALPEIAKIDFNNLDGSGEVLTRFVLAVTYAMKTSIAGILYSLIMTVLNTLAPVRGTRQKTFKKVSNCFENIWIAIHGEKNMEHDIHKYLPLILEEIKKANGNSDKGAA